VAFAFSGTFCLFPVFHEISDKSKRNMSKVIAASNVVCMVGYGAVALVGALTFGVDVDRDGYNVTQTASNYLYVFPPNHYAVSVLRFFLVITITLLFAVINFPMLTAIDSLLSMALGATQTTPGVLRTHRTRTIVTVIAMTGMTAIDIAISDLTVLFGLCGGWGMTFVCYFVPSLIGFAAPSNKNRPVLRFMLALSALAVLILAGAFTYVVFEPVANNNTKTATGGLSAVRGMFAKGSDDFFGPGEF